MKFDLVQSSVDPGTLYTTESFPLQSFCLHLPVSLSVCLSLVCVKYNHISVSLYIYNRSLVLLIKYSDPDILLLHCNFIKPLNEIWGLKVRTISFSWNSMYKWLVVHNRREPQPPLADIVVPDSLTQSGLLSTAHTMSGIHLRSMLYATSIVCIIH